MRPVLLGVEPQPVQTWCQCGGLNVIAFFGWEIASKPWTIEKAAFCVECGTREKAHHE